LKQVVEGASFLFSIVVLDLLFVITFSDHNLAGKKYQPGSRMSNRSDKSESQKQEKKQ
jgi:hypothetical protein